MIGGKDFTGRGSSVRKILRIVKEQGTVQWYKIWLQPEAFGKVYEDDIVKEESNQTKVFMSC